jgi:hypothetical protein
MKASFRAHTGTELEGSLVYAAVNGQVAVPGGGHEKSPLLTVI